MAACSELAKFVSHRSCRVPCALSELGKPPTSGILCSFIVYQPLCKRYATQGLRNRQTKRKAKPVSTSVKSPPASRPSTKRLQWSNQQMEAAMKAVESGSGINQLKIMGSQVPL